MKPKDLGGLTDEALIVDYRAARRRYRYAYTVKPIKEAHDDLKRVIAEAEARGLDLAEYSDDQERDDSGKWTSGGGGGAAGGKGEKTGGGKREPDAIRNEIAQVRARIAKNSDAMDAAAKEKDLDKRAQLMKDAISKGTNDRERFKDLQKEWADTTGKDWATGRPVKDVEREFSDEKPSGRLGKLQAEYDSQDPSDPIQRAHRRELSSKLQNAKAKLADAKEKLPQLRKKWAASKDSAERRELSTKITDLQGVIYHFEGPSKESAKTGGES